MASSIAGLPILDDTFYVNDVKGVKQYSFVVFDTTAENYCKTPTANGQMAVGVALEDAANGNDCLVRVLGLAPVYVQCAINPGDKISVNSASAWASVAGTGDVIVGIARGKATEAGELINVLLTPNGAIA